MAVINLSAGNFLALNQSGIGQSNHKYETVAQGLVISQLARSSKQFIDSNQLLNIAQLVSLTRISNLSIDNSLNIKQVMGPTRYFDVSNVLQLRQSGAKGESPVVSNKLTISQQAIPSRGLTHSLIVGHTLSIGKILNRGPNQSLTIVSQVSVYKVDALDACKSPFAIEPVPVILISDFESLTLKIPELGDSDRIELSRVQELTRGGDLIIFSDPVWPKTEILKFNFHSMNRDLALELLKFMEDSIGLLITLIDHQNISWSGIILNPETPIACTNDNNCGSYDVELQFQGERI